MGTRTTPAKEYATQYLHGLNPFGIAANISGMIKAIQDPPSQTAARSGEDNLMPSVGSYRMVHRAKSQAYAQDSKYHGHAKNNYLSEILGTFTSGVLPTIAGGIIGAYKSRDKLMDGNLGWKDRLLGTASGVGAGLAVATAGNLIALLASAITKRRTEREQVQHDKRRHWEDWLIPGPAMYNKGKRQGRSEGDYEEHPETHKEIQRNLHDESNNESPKMRALKAIAMAAGIAMTGYGLYKLPGVMRGEADKIKKVVSDGQ